MFIIRFLKRGRTGSKLELFSFWLSKMEIRYIFRFSLRVSEKHSDIIWEEGVSRILSPDLVKEIRILMTEMSGWLSMGFEWRLLFPPPIFSKIILKPEFSLSSSYIFTKKTRVFEAIHQFQRAWSLLIKIFRFLEPQNPALKL